MVLGFKRGEGKGHGSIFILTAAVASSLLLLGMLTATTAGTAQAIGVKKIEVTYGGYGEWQCARMFSSNDWATSSLGQLQMQLSVTKNTSTGMLEGTWKMANPGSSSSVSGTVTKGIATGGSFILTGTETSNSNPCSPVPFPVVITGKCGTNAGIALAAQKFEAGTTITRSAAFGNVTVACT